MNKSMLNILACPIDKTYPLELHEIKEKADVIFEGILYCSKCSRFFPIIEEIPILLPDELRDKKMEIEFLKTYKEKLPEKIIRSSNPWHL
jgi:uncharacterized protein YbaR (Trm112 family)